MRERVLLLGASSAIARNVAASLAARGSTLCLAGRDIDDLRRVSSNLKIRFGIEADAEFFDAEDFAAHKGFLEKAVGRMGGMDGVILAFGYLGDQERAAHDFSAADKVINANFTGAVSILTHCAAHLEEQRSGYIVGLSSVAGDRGRAPNYVYGSAKGALSLYLQGLRARLSGSGVRVLTIKLGFVDTAMTFDLPQTFLVASPEYVGERIVRALGRSRDIVYLPWFWRYIMWAVRLIPERLFKNMSF